MAEAYARQRPVAGKVGACRDRRLVGASDEAIVCAACAAEGVSVVVAGRDDERTDAVGRRGGRDRRCRPASARRAFAAVLGDVARVADCERMVAEAVAQHGRIDVLVNSAGIWIEKPITAMSEADYDLAHGQQSQGHLLHVPRGAART